MYALKNARPHCLIHHLPFAPPSSVRLKTPQSPKVPSKLNEFGVKHGSNLCCLVGYFI